MATKTKTVKMVDSSAQTVEARQIFCKGESGSEKGRSQLAERYDDIFPFNWTMRADGKFDKKANGKLDKANQVLLKSERDTLEQEYYAEIGAKDKTKFDNAWDYVKGLSKHRADAAGKKKTAQSTEREKWVKLIRALYNKSSDPEAVTQMDTQAMVTAIAKHEGITLD